jgi:hypothetical protein
MPVTYLQPLLFVLISILVAYTSIGLAQAAPPAWPDPLLSLGMHPGDDAVKYSSLAHRPPVLGSNPILVPVTCFINTGLARLPAAIQDGQPEVKLEVNHNLASRVFINTSATRSILP